MASRNLAVPTVTRANIANLMTQVNQSLGLTVSEHIERIHEHASAPTFDYALANTGAIFATFRARPAMPLMELTDNR
jgi:2-phospho-L-lactate transferase/gluconeogenesis factor (CofD/UPF0052 family)